MAPGNWERKGNVPALVRLLRAYLKQGAAEVVPTHLEAILGTFQKLLSAKSTEGDAFCLLDGLIARVPPANLGPYLPTIVNLLMMRLQSAGTLRYSKLLVRALCYMAAKLGAGAVVEGGLEVAQAGLFAMVVSSAWLKALEASPPTHGDAKVVAFGTARILAESAAVQGNAACWTALLGSLCGVLEPSAASASGGEVDDEDGVGEEVVGFDGDAYSKLHFTGAGEEDPLPEVPNAPAACCQALATLCAAHPGVFLARVQQLPSAQGAALLKQCQAAGVSLV